MKWGTTISKNGTPFIIGKPCGNKLHYFDMELAKSTNEVMNTVINTVSCDCTLWHRRMGHVNQCMIKNLTDNTEGGPDNVTETPKETCKGCKKGKLKRLPFPPSKSRATWPLDLVHSDLDGFPVCSRSSYKWTVTYLDDHSSYGVMSYLKRKDEEFTAFKAYQAWAKRQTGTKLKCKRTDWGGEFLSNE